MDRPATALGPIGLVLPAFVQDTTPAWVAAAGGIGHSATGGPVPGRAPRVDPIAELASICKGAEQLGADALWTCDHLFWHGPSLECMVTLTVAATATDRSMLGTCIMQLPLRQAAAVAKQSATLQVLTCGRFILGVGVGSHPGEYEQVGVDYPTRNRQLDAGIGELRRSWASGHGMARGDTGAEGAERYRQLPEPPTVPVWVGGSSEAALRRAARLGDGWIPLYLKPGEYEDALDRLAKEVDRAERAAGSVTPSIVLFVSIGEDPMAARHRGTGWMSTFYGIPAKAFDRHLVSGTATEVADVIKQYQRAGAEHVAVYVTDDQPLQQFERLASALRAASGTRRG